MSTGSLDTSFEMHKPDLSNFYKGGPGSGEQQQWGGVSINILPNVVSIAMLKSKGNLETIK